jgi:hypothetical protein
MIWTSGETSLKHVFDFTTSKHDWLALTISRTFMSPFGAKVLVNGCGRASRRSCSLTSGNMIVSAHFMFKRSGIKACVFP